jgi:hypothetical protein
MGAKGILMPIDPTPQGSQVTRELPEPQYPEPKPQAEDRQRRPAPEADRDQPDPAGARVDPLTGAGEDIAG